jgi:hypothetical protein
VQSGQSDVSQIKYDVGSLRSAQDDLNDLVEKFPMNQDDSRENSFALVLSGMGRNASFRSCRRAQSAPEGLGERVSNGLNQFRMMSYQMNSEIRTLSADMQGATLAAWEQTCEPESWISAN